tara:strand:- start:14 stop:175 length:162 start_codon:yes stop_codon:yes gene_type:complete
MNKNSNPRNGSIHLYDPKQEGLGSYDVNYINAYKKEKIRKESLKKKNAERLAA